MSDGTNGVVVIGPFHLYGPGLSAIVIVLVYTLTPPKETVNKQDAEFVIEWKSYQKVKVYSRVVSNEYRVWYILALEGVNEVAEFKMAYNILHAQLLVVDSGTCGLLLLQTKN